MPQNNPLLPLAMLAWVLAPPVTADQALLVDTPPVIDGIADEATWQQGPWYPIDQHILGEMPKTEDFSGRYTLRWDRNRLYLLAEINDDVLVDQHPDPKHKYWEDDCLEVFIDEDASGGEHTYSYNAFAYHVALDNQAADIGPNPDPNAAAKGEVVLLNHHIESRWQRSEQAPYAITWELALAVYDDSYTTLGKHMPVTLEKGKTMGFMLAYCDNDGNGREHFIGSHPIKAKNGDKNLGYIDASVFDQLVLIGVE